MAQNQHTAIISSLPPPISEATKVQGMDLTCWCWLLVRRGGAMVPSVPPVVAAMADPALL